MSYANERTSVLSYADERARVAQLRKRVAQRSSATPIRLRVQRMRSSDPPHRMSLKGTCLALPTPAIFRMAGMPSYFHYLSATPCPIALRLESVGLST